MNPDKQPLFVIDDEQNKKATKFSEQHTRCQRGAIGGAVSYIFTPTSIGIIFKMKCACGAEADFTEYGDW